MADNYLEKKMEQYLANKGNPAFIVRTIIGYAEDLDAVNDFYINKLEATHKDGSYLLSWLNIKVKYEVGHTSLQVVIDSISPHGLEIIMNKLTRQAIDFQLTDSALTFCDPFGLTFKIIK